MTSFLPVLNRKVQGNFCFTQTFTAWKRIWVHGKCGNPGVPTALGVRVCSVIVADLMLGRYRHQCLFWDLDFLKLLIRFVFICDRF